MIFEIDRYGGDGWAEACKAERDAEARAADREERLRDEADAAWLEWMASLRRHYGHAAECRSLDAHPTAHHPDCVAAWCRYCGSRDAWQSFALDRSGLGAFAGLAAALTDPRGRPA